MTEASNSLSANPPAAQVITMARYLARKRVKDVGAAKDEQCPRNVGSLRFGAEANRIVSTISPCCDQKTDRRGKGLRLCKMRAPRLICRSSEQCWRDCVSQSTTTRRASCPRARRRTLEGCACGLRRLHRDLGRQIRQGGRVPDQGSRRAARLLRLSDRALEASAHDERRGKLVRHGAPPHRALQRMSLKQDRARP
jgi:hypothetical protein